MIIITKTGCRLCGEITAEKKDTGDAVYYHCSNCDFIFIDESFFMDDDEECSRYKMHDNTVENKGYVNNFKKFIKTAEIDKLEREERVLDFGCGPGPVLKYLLNQMGFNNVDIYDPYFYPEKVYQGKKYGLITCTEVLEHLKNPYEIIKLLESFLKRSGHLAVTTLFHTTCEDFNKWWYRRDPTHICFYSPSTFGWIREHFQLELEIIDYNSICVLKKL